MSQSLSENLLHIVFSTHKREQRIYDEIRPDMFSMLAVCVERTRSHAYRIGGVADHVHLAVRLHPTLALSQFINSLKTESSRWLKQQSGIRSDFHWQNGYAAFSVCQNHLPDLVAYIDRQEEHHRKVGFKDEFRKLCLKNGVVLDERYVWD